MIFASYYSRRHYLSCLAYKHTGGLVHSPPFHPHRLVCCLISPLFTTWWGTGPRYHWGIQQARRFPCQLACEVMLVQGISTRCRLRVSSIPIIHNSSRNTFQTLVRFWTNVADGGKATTQYLTQLLLCWQLGTACYGVVCHQVGTRHIPPKMCKQRGFRG